MAEPSEVKSLQAQLTRLRRVLSTLIENIRQGKPGDASENPVYTQRFSKAFVDFAYDALSWTPERAEAMSIPGAEVLYDKQHNNKILTRHQRDWILDQLPNGPAQDILFSIDEIEQRVAGLERNNKILAEQFKSRHGAGVAPIDPTDEMLISGLGLLANCTVAAPIDMILICPNPECAGQHIDGPDGTTQDGDPVCSTWNNPPHRSHLCAYCGTIWRPADVPTNGAVYIKTHGAADTWLFVASPGKRNPRI